MNRKNIVGQTYADLIRKAIGEKDAQQLLNADLGRSSRGYQKLLNGERGFSEHFNAPRSNRPNPLLADDSVPQGKTTHLLMVDW